SSPVSRLPSPVSRLPCPTPGLARRAMGREIRVRPGYGWAGGVMDEDRLVRLAKEGDREAFAGLVRLHQERLRGLVALSIPGRDDVHDLVQEAFVDAWKGLDGFDASCPFGPWLRAICRNRVRKFLRDRLPQRRR